MEIDLHNSSSDTQPHSLTVNYGLGGEHLFGGGCLLQHGNLFEEIH